MVFINLDAASDRRAFMEAQARRHGLRLERLRATEPTDFAPGQYERLSGQWDRILTPNELAAFLSPQRAWARAATEPQGLIVFEDDAVLSPRFREVAERLPADLDLINLEDVGRRKFFRRAGPVMTGRNFTVSRVARERSGAGAYHLSPEGAERLLALAETRAAPVDAFMYGVARLDIGQVEPALTTQAHLLAEMGVDPGIQTSTSIDKRRTLHAVGAARLRHGWRRLATQTAMAGFHLRRLTDLSLRKTAFDLNEFETAADPPPEQGQSARDQTAS